MTSWRTLLQQSLRKKRFWGALAGMCIILAVSAYALYGMFRGGQQGLTFEQLRAHLTPGVFLNASLVYAADLALAITGWILIMGTLSEYWDWPQHARVYCINSVTRRLPGSMWYLLGRVVMYEKQGIPRSLTLIASGIEYIVTLLGGLLVAILAWPIVLSGSRISPLWLIAALFAGGLLLNPPALRAIVKRLSPQTHALNLRYRHLIGWIVFYGLVWCGGGGILFVLAQALHPLPLAALPAIMGVWATSALLPQLLTFMPFGLGVQEVTLSALLSPFVGSTEAIVVALLMRIVLTLNEVLWACIAWVIRLPDRAQSPSAEPSVEQIDPNQKMTTLSSTRSIEKSSSPRSDGQKPQEVPPIRSVIPPK